MTRPRPSPPLPDQIRRPRASFGWLDTSLLHDHTLARLGPRATAVLLLLALAADEKGASFYGRAKMGAMLGMELESVTQALGELLQWKLVAFKPWRPGCMDGVWQLLPVKHPETNRDNKCLPIASILHRLGIKPDGMEG